MATESEKNTAAERSSRIDNLLKRADEFIRENRKIYGEPTKKAVPAKKRASKKVKPTPEENTESFDVVNVRKEVSFETRAEATDYINRHPNPKTLNVEYAVLTDRWFVWWKEMGIKKSSGI